MDLTDNSRSYIPYAAISQGVSLLSNLFSTPNADLNANNALAATMRAGISNALMSSGNPYAMLAGAGVQFLNNTGGFSGISLGFGRYDTANKIMSYSAPGLGYVLGKTHDYKMSNTLLNATSYAGTYKLGQKALLNAGNKVVFGRKSINKLIDNAQLQDQAVLEITDDSQDAFNRMLGNTSIIGTRNSLALQGSQGLARAAKFGTKLERVYKTKLNILNKLKDAEFFDNLQLSDEEFFKSLKLGGTIDSDLAFFNSLQLVAVPEFKAGGEVNVIPEGALHARKHNMENSENLTKKGIPVVSDGEGGDLQLQAEIERNEIIFRLEVTKEIEKLLKEFNDSDKQSDKDEIAIEAGKLIAKEIMENTEDRTGLMLTI